MTRKIVFAGPSVSQLDCSAFDDIEFRDPCKQGDVYLAGQDRPAVIGIIDGYFDGMPSVWHKEILWTMHQGIHVLGAASMGALRACELHPFGMVGIGKIFEWYRDGIITDDDEVALVHGPGAAGYVGLSEPMVNIRATLEQARMKGIVNEAEQEDLLTAAKGTFYQKRNWETLLADIAGSAGQLEGHSELPNFIEHHAIDQKREDAHALLLAMQSTDFDAPFEPEFTFENTLFWQRNIKAWRNRTVANKGRDSSQTVSLFGGD